MIDQFDASKVTFRIGMNFGKRCLLAEYEMKASVAIELNKEDTLSSFQDRFQDIIEEVRKDYQRYLLRNGRHPSKVS